MSAMYLFAPKTDHPVEFASTDLDARLHVQFSVHLQASIAEVKAGWWVAKWPHCLVSQN